MLIQALLVKLCEQLNIDFDTHKLKNINNF